MIRKFRETDLNTIMRIWLDANMQAHSFIAGKYWQDHYETVRTMLPQAEVYVYEDDAFGRIMGFAGLDGSYIAGIFVKEEARSKGVGKQLMDYVKNIKSNLILKVYKENERAVRFYERELFVVQSESVDEDTGADELVMSWKRQERT